MNWYKVWQENHIFNVENNMLKNKKFIFTPYIKVNQDGFINGSFREFLFSDSLARYFRYRGDNVMYAPGFDTLSYSSFIESKVESNELNMKLYDKYLEELVKLNIGFPNNKAVNCLDRETLLFIQKFFLYFYNKGLIKYKQKEVLEDVNKKKIYDGIETNYKNYKSSRNVFVLDIEKAIPKIVKNISSLAIPEEIKLELIAKLGIKENLVLSVYTRNNHEMKLFLEEPEILGSLTAIVLNPSKMDILDYIAPEEIFAIENFLETKNNKYIYSGNDFINPLTGSTVPIFISYAFDNPIKPLFSHRPTDLIYISELELEPINIIEDNVLINSDFLNGMSLEQAHNKIIEVFVEEELGYVKNEYNKKEILISSLDVLGCPYPLMLGNNDIITLEDHLPLTFSNKFRILIPKEEEISSEYQLFSGSINSLFCNGIYPFASLLLEKNIEIEDVINNSILNELKEWLKQSVFVINKHNLVYDLFMPIVMISLLEEEENFELELPFEIILFDNVYDAYGNEIRKEFNNCLRIDEMIDVYGSDAIRLYYLDSIFEKQFYFSKEKLFMYKQFLLSIKNIYSLGFSSNNLDLEFGFYQFKNKLYDCLVSYNFKEYISNIKDFINKVNGKQLTKKMALELLVLMSIVLPELAEDLHYAYFSTKQLLIDNNWPL